MPFGGNAFFVFLNVDCGRAGRRYYKAQNWCNLRREKFLVSFSRNRQDSRSSPSAKSKNQKIKIVSNQRSALVLLQLVSEFSHT